MKKLQNRVASSFVLLLTAIALAGCAVDDPMGPLGFLKNNPKPCPPGQCEITVTVTSCANPGGISVDPSFVSTDKRNTMMRWKIVTPGYEFAADGIAVYHPDGEFEPKPLPGQAPNEFRMLNKNSKPGNKPGGYVDYGYAVQVKVPGGLNCTVLDPWIRNSF